MLKERACLICKTAETPFLCKYSIYQITRLKFLHDVMKNNVPHFKTCLMEGKLN